VALRDRSAEGGLKPPHAVLVEDLVNMNGGWAR
jgi:hypothetical protein